ncbi:regulatory protein, luxR family [Rhodococcus triatomae]|uniref:Regulatory protein, luxR family n=1 Tax=Rhodococcus triatomae TaxID=300028 RepID=A0A1G8Q4L1_9NOCA|nr:regulatory protein, luxR family [Rhodococcus triatomae]
MIQVAGHSTPLLRPRDADALRGEIRRIAAAQVAPVVFGGSVADGALQLTEFAGTRTNGLRGLLVPPRTGLGGCVVESLAPAAVPDYGRSASITHQYDGPVLGEGLRSVLAVPVVVQGTPRAVLYAALRRTGPVGDRAGDAMLAACRRLAAEIEVRDEVDRRLIMLGSLTPSSAEGMSLEEVRDIHAELRSVADRVSDTALRDTLRALSRRLADVVRGAGPAPLDEAPPMSPRELDVLSHVALGCTNSEVAQRLSLGPETVKSYLRTAMRKLDASTRHEAVVAARRLGLLP